MNSWLPPLVVLSSAIPGVVIFALPEARHVTRRALNLAGAVLKLAMIAFMLHGVTHGEVYEVRYPLLPGQDFVLAADGLAMLFATLSGVLWLVTTVYAIGYLAHSPNRSRFFGFFSLCVSATTGIAFAGNPITFLIFYEALTLTTYPLVVHRGDRESIAAGRTYLAFTLSGGAILMLATVWLHAVVGPFDFASGGALAHMGVSDRSLVPIFALFVLGLGVKTALVPLHPWLPAAMVAPAPVSALLHAVAVVKAGAFGILRLVYEIFGIGLSRDLGVLPPLSAWASFTIIYGSLRALAQRRLKKLLAYSTVSQLSYIVLGASIPGDAATIGALVHLIHQGIMKVTLFFCAGVYQKALGVHHIDELDGVGKRMPLVTGAFTAAALGMIGLPPLAGFVSKLYLGVGAIDAGQPWVVAVLAASTLLNAAYFLPLIHAAWFRERAEPWPESPDGAQPLGRLETSAWLLGPLLVTGALSVVLGLSAVGPVGVVGWAEMIVARGLGR